MNRTSSGLWLPNGDELIASGTARIWDYWEAQAVKRRGGVAKAFTSLPLPHQVAWMKPQRVFAELIAIALITDQREVMAGYDQVMGGAYDRAVIKYAREELNFDPTATLISGEPS